MKIALASDHVGYRMKQGLIAALAPEGYQLLDLGTDSTEAVDYPDFIRPAAQSVADGSANVAIVLGGSGNGEAIVANKVRSIRCALCWNEESARLAKEYNNANVISIGARTVNQAQATRIVDAWLRATFRGGRHLRQIDKIECCQDKHHAIPVPMLRSFRHFLN